MIERVLCLLVASTLAVTAGTGLRAQDPELAIPRLTASVDTAVREAMREHRLPGAAVVLVKDGKTVFRRGYGLANVEREIAVDPDRTLFRIGSISKALTLLTLTRMIDDGRLSADDDVAKFFDGIDNRYGFERPVTIGNLLTHTTGFDQIGGRDRQIRNYDQPLAARKAARPGLVEYLANGKLRRVSPAGLHYRYDTYGTTVAGAIIERVTGVSYAAAMRKEVFAPLGMTDSFVEADAEHVDRLAVGYEEAAGRLVAQPYEVYVTLPASSIDATPADMGRLLEALTGDGANAHGRLFGAETARAVLAPQFRLHPEFLGMTYGLHESCDASGRFEVPVRTVDHGGTMQGFKALLAVVPESGLGVFVVTNRSGGGRDPLAAAVMGAVIASLPEPPTREPFPVPERDAARDLAEYVGDYYYGVFCHRCTADEVADGAWRRGAPRSVTQRDGALLIGTDEYLPRGDGIFIRIDGHQKVFFGRNDAGRVAFFAYASSADTFERELPGQPYVEIRSLAQSVHEVAREDGITAAVEHFHAAKDSGRHYLREDEMNRVGYALLGAERTKDAIEIFKLIVGAFPESWNAYDSLGEACLADGDKQPAIENYRKSVELNPENTAGIAVLKRLEGKDLVEPDPG